MALHFLIKQLCLCLLCLTLGVFIPVIVYRFLLKLFLEQCDSFLEGIRFKLVHEGCYSFESKNSPLISSLRVFQNIFYSWSETFEIVVFAT